MAAVAPYPVKVEAQLDEGLSRWLWLVKWFLAIPHFVVLAFLWIAFWVLSIVAFFAILFTGRYPRSIFEFNVGVLRWSWRVGYYSFAAFGTDRYPPFTLAEVPDYPAHLDIEYPDRLSRGLVLVKWWLLAIPHYLIVGLLMGGTWVAWSYDGDGVSAPGLIGILALIAVVAFAFTGTYPRSLFDLILGFDRWVLRVAAYVGLMTDTYPPFRLDSGGSESGARLGPPPPPSPEGGVAGASGSTGWTAGRVTSMVIGSLAILIAFAFISAGGAGLWAHVTQRDSDGFLMSPERTFTTDTYAIVESDIDLEVEDAPDWLYPSSVLGDARLTAVSLNGREIFLGVGRTADVERYVSGMRHASVSSVEDAELDTVDGAPPRTLPSESDVWVATAVGSGSVDLDWDVDSGPYSVVVMDAEAESTIAVRARAGAEVPALIWAAGTAAFVGALLMLAGVALAVVAIRRASR